MEIIGITASNGKTSTSMMLKSILDLKKETGLIGTIKYKIKGKEIASKLTTPESLELQALFEEMKEAGLNTVIMEVSSIAQEMFRTYGTKFKVVCMNNITREHIDQHGSFEKYFSEKKKLITNADKDTYVILNINDKYVKTLVNETKGILVTYSDIYDPAADIYASDIDLSSGFAKFNLNIKNLKFEDKVYKDIVKQVKLSVFGYHSIVNALSAISMALCLNIDLDTIIKGIESYMGIERRFQLVYNREFMVLDDHFANIGNINMTLASLEMMKYKNLYMVYAIRGNRGVTVNEENVNTIIKWKDKIHFDKIIASLSRDTTKKHDYVSDAELEIFERKMEEAGMEYDLRENLRDALDDVLKIAGEGDLILLAGCQGIDHGARFLLEEIYKRDGSKDESILEPIKNRICGWD